MADFVEVINIKNRMCESVECCRDCPIDNFKNGKNIGCGSFLKKYPEQAQEILLKWAEEHPIFTNADKFDEVFGFRPNIDSCSMFGCEICINTACIECPYLDYWLKEYKEPEVK